VSSKAQDSWMSKFGIDIDRIRSGGGSGPQRNPTPIGGVTLDEPKVGMPSPMMSDDCVPVRGKVPGPAEHLLCSTHGHIVDIKQKTIIAKNLNEYLSKGAAGGGSGGSGGAGGGGTPHSTGLDIVPGPMLPDCAPVRGKVPGPAEHLLCSKHGHIVDIKSKSIIAKNLNDYLSKRGGGSVGGGTPHATGLDIVPGPMLPDCTPVKGKVPGPAEHLMCSKHGHVVDISTKKIIARTLDDYKKGPKPGPHPPSMPGVPASPGKSTPAAAAGAVTLSIQFNAFIPSSLGRSVDSFPFPTDLKNQATFEGLLKGVSGTWLKEPGSFADNNTGPWLFATDNRGFGGGTHRVGCSGTVSSADVGSLKSKGALFSHSTSGSERVRWRHTGLLTSSNETGSVEGPIKKAAKVKSSESHEDVSADESVITTEGAASYPFSALAPDIDYKLALRLIKAGGKLHVEGEITTNEFPFYELIINGSVVWRFSSSSTGPGTNLLKSTKSKLARISF
jgi:hypothetical protein